MFLADCLKFSVKLSVGWSNNLRGALHIISAFEGAVHHDAKNSQANRWWITGKVCMTKVLVENCQSVGLREWVSYSRWSNAQSSNWGIEVGHLSCRTWLFRRFALEV